MSINIRGNEYNDKFYCSLQGWKIEAYESSDGYRENSAVNQYQQQHQQPPQGYANPAGNQNSDDDDGGLPF